MSAADPVDQARAWLAAQTGQSGPQTGRSVLPPGAPAAPGTPGDARSSRPDSGGSSRPGSGGSSRPGSARAARTDPAGPSRSGRARPDWSGANGPVDEDADPESIARTIALRKLTAQARTRHELDEALRKKNVPEEAAAAVLDRLEEVGSVDDQAFAQDWVASRQQRRHLSRSALRRELQAKGIDREHLDEALATVDSDDELNAARALAAKKAAAMRTLEPMVRDRRLAGALARRGFGSGIISAVLDELRQGEL